MSALPAYKEDQDVLAATAEVTSIVQQARDLKIVDAQTNQFALDMLASCRKAVKKVDALKKRWLDPLNDQIKLIRGDFDSMKAPAQEADSILSAKTSEYRAKERERAAKAQARANAIAERRIAKAAQDAEARGDEAPIVAPVLPSVVAPAKSIGTADGGSVSYRKTPHIEIVDAAAVPRAFCIPNEKAIRAALVNGVVAEIPGVRFWYTEDAVVRS